MSNSRFVKVSRQISLSGTGASTDRIPLPKARVDHIGIRFDYTVTDAGITAGENLAGVITQLIIGDEAAPLIDVRKDEITSVIDMLVEGISTGFYVDTTPTTETEMHAYFVIPGPFQLAGYYAPEVILSTNPVGEFGGASAFVGTVSVDIVLSKPSEQHLPGARVYRYASGSGTTHALPLGPGIVKDLLMITGTANYLSEVRLAAPAYGGGKSETDFEVKTNYPKALADEFARLKRATAVYTKYFVPGLDSQPYTGREIEAVMSTATTLVIFARNVVSAKGGN